MKIGIYAGSFNPFHLGHYDILIQAEQVFDKVILAVGENPEKSYQQRTELPDSVKNSSVVIKYNGLLTEMMAELNKQDKYNCLPLTLIRGLRNGHDLEYEQNQIAFMKGLMPSLKVIFFICDPKYQHVSSSALRALRKFSEEEYNRYIVK
jgi:pantetheine-phosphate adenylyltransferase